MSKNPKHSDLVSIDEFFAGSEVTVSEVTQKPRTAARVLGALAALVALALIAGAVITLPTIYALSAVAQVAEEPINLWKQLPEDLEEVAIAERNRLYDANGNVFAEFWSEDRIKLEELAGVSEFAQEALIATEDKRFYSHKGIDFIGTARAAIYSSGGGSGITQQLIKNLQFYNQAGTEDGKSSATEQSLERKLRELRYAMGYEKTHDKKEILLQYFNTVAFGSPNIYSIESASRYFFSKAAADLTLAEAAALIGTVKNPSLYDMDSAENTAWKERQQVVLERMREEGYITAAEEEEAFATELVFTKTSNAGNCTASAYPFYCEYVIGYLKNSSAFGETPEERSTILARGGLNIYTYLDPRIMNSIDARLQQDIGNDNRVVAPAAVVQPGTGGVQAIAVNREYGEGPGSTTINVALNPTATGSTYKAVTLAASVNAGFEESQLAFASASCPFREPGYDFPVGGIRNSTSCALQGGNLNYEQATGLSSNTWYLTLATKVGMQKVFDMSKALGLRVPDNISTRSLSFVLGSVENTPVAMAAAYATFANEGVFCPATPVLKYEYSDGSRPAVPDTYDPTSVGCRAAMSPHAASVVLKSLRANTVPDILPTAFGTMGYIPGYDAVGKTGTNEQYNYAWAQVSKGYSLFVDVYDMDNYVTGVAKNTRYQGRIFDKNVAAYLGGDLMRDVLAGTPPQPLNFDSQERSFVQPPQDTRDFFTVPNVLGMTPEQAAASLDGLPIPVHVSKETVARPALYPSGVVSEQSLAPGTQLPIGTKKELLLYLGE